MVTMLDQVIVRAANDEVFREELLSHPDAVLASTEPILSEGECEVLNEYRRVASRVLAQQVRDSHRVHLHEEVGSAATGM